MNSPEPVQQRRLIRIGIDISRTLGEPTGVGRYAAGLVDGLAAIDQENEYLLYPRFPDCSPQEPEHARVPARPNFRLWTFDRDGGRARWFTPTEARAFGRVDVVHSTAYTAPALLRARLVVSVHDLSFVTHPRFHTEANRSFCLRQLEQAVAGDTHFLVPSLATRRDLQRAYLVPSARISVAPYAVGEEFAPIEDPSLIAPVLTRHAIEPPFVLFVGTLEPRKNLDTLLRAMAAVRAHDAPRCQLVVAGPSGWLNRPTHALVDELGLRSTVRFTGYVPDAELRALYSAAHVFVYPSVCEGFGFPVLEAMACGAPVITSNVSALPEVAGDAAILVPPDGVAELRQAIAAVLKDAELRARLRAQGGRRAALFTWEETARRTLAVYRAAVASPRGASSDREA
jgi:glycosyltransferase involved in cell wall biosynthesis